ncbi:glycosyltransferase [uncultured Algoriphagus sp.]|uniref:glycosyltransferase n=1 Tax=uncultured Algoriphagus sp. TaxID=417365 RepID=UPI0030EB1882
MIPKIIHYCWFGNGELSSSEICCIESWRKFCPDFEIRLWNESNFDINFCEFTKIAYKQKKYAFVSDVARIYALYSEGGVYLDTDMLLINQLPEKFLSFNLFLGKESKSLYNAAILGSAKENIILKQMLNYYINSSSSIFQNQLIPQIITKELSSYNESVDFNSFPPDYFYPLPYQLRYFHYNQFLTRNTIAVHLWNLSWKNTPTLSLRDKFLRYIKYCVSYFYIPQSFKDFASKSFY